MEELQFSLTLISPFSFKDCIRNLKADLLFVILKQNNGRLFTLATIYFNLVLNPEKDKKGGLAKTHTKAVNVYIKKELL